MYSVVTGALGHIGTNLTRALLRRGDAVRALVHLDAAALDGLDVEIARGDVCDRSTLDQCFAGANTVFHLAGQITVSRRDNGNVFRVNVEGVRNVVEACRSCGVKCLVHCSSVHAMIDPGENHRVDEATPLAEDSHHSPYDRSKAAGERVALDASSDALRVVVLAPTAVVGPYDHRPSYFGRVLLTMAHNRLPVRVGGGFDWVDVRDVVAGIIAASQRGEAGRKYLLSGHWRSLAEVADLVAAATGGRRPLVPIPLSLARACSPIGERMACLMRRTPLFTPYSVEALGHHRQVSHERASEELGYTPRPLEVTIVDTLQWFADNGFLDCTVMGSGAHQ